MTDGQICANLINHVVTAVDAASEAICLEMTAVIKLRTLTRSLVEKTLTNSPTRCLSDPATRVVLLGSFTRLPVELVHTNSENLLMDSC